MVSLSFRTDRGRLESWRFAPRGVARLLAALWFLTAASVSAQTRLLPLGDSITNGGQAHASWRYALHEQLTTGGFAIDMVGTQSAIFGGDPPNLAWYPGYLTTFDRDHEGHWGWRTDQILAIAGATATVTQPDIVLMHLGTNDLGQLGAAGVTTADANLRAIVADLRAARPGVTVLLAEIVPIGPGTAYFSNAGQVVPFNAVVRQIATDLDLPGARVLAVDLNGGYDLGTMMQGDGLHPNLTGEAWMAARWSAALAPFLGPGNPLPSVQLTAPPDGASFTAPPVVALAASASDPNGSVVAVRFRAGSLLLGIDAAAPWEWDWLAPPPGNHALTAEAVDDGGATRLSAPVGVTILPAGGGIAIPIPNASFEVPLLGDGVIAPGPGEIGGWNFQGTAGTYVGIFNPPTGSYPSAGGGNPPAGADGANAAYLFNYGGDGDSVSLTMTLAEAAMPGHDYTLRVAIGRFLPNQPYAFSTYGGFVAELRVGGAVVGSLTNSVTPPEGEFRDALLVVPASAIPPEHLGEPLAIRFGLPSRAAPRSTHFDHVRLERIAAASAVAAPDVPDFDVPLLEAPNPWRAGGLIRYRTPAAGRVTFELFDVLGRRVGRHAVTAAAGAWVSWSPPELAAGAYRLRVSAGGRVERRSLVRGG